MWIGIMDSNHYNHHRSVRRRQHAITYNDGGLIHAFGSGLYDKNLEAYTSGHWLHFDLFLSKSPSACAYNMSKASTTSELQLKMNDTKINETFRRYLDKNDNGNQLCFIMELDA